MIQNRVKKCVFPVAGLGSRFLPATKATPKEMLPIVDKPLIQYAVEEAIEAGITQMIFVTGRHKRAIEDHFDTAFELEAELTKNKKDSLLKLLESTVPKDISFIYIRQNAPLGLGHAVLCAEPSIDNEPFAVILADDFIQKSPDQPHFLKTMVDHFNTRNHSVLCTRKVSLEQTKSYGVVVTNEKKELINIVEKPEPQKAPSRDVIVGRYVFTSRLLHHLASQKPGSGGEIQLTDSIAALLQDEKITALPLTSKHFDCGEKLGYSLANAATAFNHPEFGSQFQSDIKTLLELDE